MTDLDNVTDLAARPVRKKGARGLISQHDAAVLLQRPKPLKEAIASIRSVAAGDIRRSPDGRYILVEQYLGGDRWGCDLLESPEGYPDRDGAPGCYGLAMWALDLGQYPLA